MSPDVLKSASIRPLARSEYDQLVQQGWFERERIELLYGMLVSMSPQDPKHTHAVTRLNALFTPALSGKAEVRVQSPFALSDNSEPEPDVAIVPSGNYSADHPSKAFLIIEVANSSLTYDRSTKGPLYAAAGIPEYWIINLKNDCIERFTQPEPSGYVRSEVIGRGAVVAPLEFPELRISVDAVLPPPATH